MLVNKPKRESLKRTVLILTSITLLFGIGGIVNRFCVAFYRLNEVEASIEEVKEVKEKLNIQSIEIAKVQTQIKSTDEKVDKVIDILLNQGASK